MDQAQYRRWYAFAIRMAHRGWPRLPRRSRKKVAQIVDRVFDGIRSEARWDPTLIERIVDWDYTEHKPGRDPLSSRSIVSDLVSDVLLEENPGNGYDEDAAWRRWDDLWGTRVRCCIRAGLDVASSPSAGVVGFDVCDLRRMYAGIIPEWLNKWFVDGDGNQVDLNQGECKVPVWL